LAAGVLFAGLHGLYALARLDRVTITSKQLGFSPLSLAGSFLLAGCGTFLFLAAKTWLGRALAVGVATLWALVPAAFGLGAIGLINLAYFRPRLGTGLYNYSLGLPLVALGFAGTLFWLALALLARKIRMNGKET
jgi:hypothetical protein